MPNYTEYEDQSIHIIEQSKEEFGSGLFALTSFGNESALLLNLIKKSGAGIPVLTVDTGFWFPETRQHQHALEHQLGFTALKYRPDDTRLAQIEEARLWEADLDEYNRLTKVSPLSQAIGELGVTALLSGVRSHQNDNRGSFNTYGIGNDDEWRIHPVLDWTESAVADYFRHEDLPRHPLQAQGYGSVGDWTITVPGSRRQGRNLGAKSECGLHVPVTERTSAA